MLIIIFIIHKLKSALIPTAPGARIPPPPLDLALPIAIYYDVLYALPIVSYKLK